MDGKATQKIQEYILQYRSQGYSDEQIRSALVKSGVSSSTLSSILGTKKSSSQPFYKKWWFIIPAILLLILLILFAIFLLTEEKPVPDQQQPVEQVQDTTVEEEPVVIEQDLPVCGDGTCESDEICVPDCGCETTTDCFDYYLNSMYVCLDGECVRSNFTGSSGTVLSSSTEGASTEIECSDTVDDDSDGYIDCDDSDCDTDEVCVSDAAVITETECSDTLDDDSDGYIDCLDEDCDTVDSCEYASELTCDDGYDNDADGDSDCDDSDCTEDAACELGITNTPPTVTLSDDSILEGDTLSVTASGNDAEGDSLTYTFSGISAGSSSGDTFTWITSSGDAGTYTLTVTVDDGTDTASDSATIIVSAVVLSPETECTNELDDDSDGYTDCLDDDCDSDSACVSLYQAPSYDELRTCETDSDCYSYEICSSFVCYIPECSDGVDNDELVDGIDYLGSCSVLTCSSSSCESECTAAGGVYTDSDADCSSATDDSEDSDATALVYAPEVEQQGFFARIWSWILSLFGVGP